MQHRDGIETIAIPRCQEEDYHSLLGVLEDADAMPTTWTGTLERAVRTEKHWRGTAKVIVRINVSVKDLVAWCNQTKKRVNTSSYHLFAATVAANKQLTNESFSVAAP